MTTYTVALPVDWLEAPAVAAYLLTSRTELRERFVGPMTRRWETRVTEDIEAAKRWLDAAPNENQARFVKAWRLPNGKLSLRDPTVVALGQLFAVEPWR